VGSDSLTWKRYGGFVVAQGEIACLGRTVVTVRKLLKFVTGVTGPDEVQTEEYSYSFSVRGAHPVFRYDNDHQDWLYPGHVDAHHKHLFDWRTGDQIEGSPIWIGAERWPTLGEVIAEAREWHAQNCNDLSAPYEFVPRSQLRDAVQRQ
jgi:hypothetical protein